MNTPVNASDLVEHQSVSYEWLGKVLTRFAIAEQAIGQLSMKLDLPTANGALSSLADLRRRLEAVDNKRCKTFAKRLDSWGENRSVRNLLAHATLYQLFDGNGELVVVTRHLPRDQDDVTPDKTWTADERDELLKCTTNDSRSIADQVANILSDKGAMQALRSV